MTRDTLAKQYFEWLCGLADVRGLSDISSYYRLFDVLHRIDFQVLIGMDENRAEDGIELRYRFGSELGYEQAMIASLLDIYPCSVLEMIVALALRCEENIMSNPQEGTAVSKWFWIMIQNLGLESMSDNNFDEEYCRAVIHRFLNREYMRDGTGGLFVIKNCKHDLRGVEIWYQMCWYLDGLLDI